jgi:hypothetical protein
MRHGDVAAYCPHAGDSPLLTSKPDGDRRDFSFCKTKIFGCFTVYFPQCLLACDLRTPVIERSLTMNAGGAFFCPTPDFIGLTVPLCGSFGPLTLAETDPWAAAVLVNELDAGCDKHLFEFLQGGRIPSVSADFDIIDRISM